MYITVATILQTGLIPRPSCSPANITHMHNYATYMYLASKCCGCAGRSAC